MSNNEIIRIENLTKIFPGKNEVTALTDINLSINRGEIFGIIGLSGAGKSTLVRCINFIERPTSGKVYIDDKDLGSMSTKELLETRRRMGMIFQQFNLLMQRTAIANITFPLELAGVPKDEALARARELLQIVGLTDKEHAYPAQLSGGQKQRIAIARALATNPDVLLCDEATSALDPTTTRSILSLLKEINQKLGITIVIITHEMSVIEEVCNRVAIIADSRIAEVGRVDEIFLKPKTKAAKQLIFPDGKQPPKFKVGDCLLRLVFDGTAPYEPIICNMAIECGSPVNILFADTRSIDGQTYGHMLIQLPDNKQIEARMKAFLEMHNVKFEEESANV